MAITKIAQIDVGTKVTSVTFSSIPSTATDLLIMASVRSDQAGPYAIEMYFNSDFTVGNYSWRGLRGNGSSATSATGANSFQSSYGLVIPGTSATSSTFGNVQIYISNYQSATAKTISIDGVGENNATTAHQSISALKWTGTAAITSVNLSPYSDYFDTGSSFTLYGISKSGATGATVA